MDQAGEPWNEVRVEDVHAVCSRFYGIAYVWTHVQVVHVQASPAEIRAAWAATFGSMLDESGIPDDWVRAGHNAALFGVEDAIAQRFPRIPTEDDYGVVSIELETGE